MFQNRLLFLIIIGLALFSFIVVLTYHNIADGDLWAKLAQGASIWNRGHLMHKDIFAFTPVLPEHIDHEWGSGLIFFSLLRLFGPESLLLLKIISALAALSFAIAVGRFNGSKWPALFLVALPCAAAILPGYVLVIRSQIMTYLFFAIILFCLEAMRRGSRWPLFAIIGVMTLWTNIHGGFISGLGIIAVYTASAFVSRRMSKIMVLTLLASIAVTFINPYGSKLWNYLIPALIHPRTYIAEWQPMSMSLRSYLGFRILFVIAIFIVIAGWDKVEWKRRLPGLITLVITAYLALRHRRHAPFFGVSAAAFLGPYLSTVSGHLRDSIKEKVRPMIIVAVIYGITAFSVAHYILPKAPFQVLAPVGFYPVRACDILMYAEAEGNLVVPFSWGNYAMWRLYPRIKISQDGRYETIYPESTFKMNRAFFYKRGNDWDRIIREYKVDYIVLELNNTRLKEDDLKDLDFKLVWLDNYSALYARKGLTLSLMKTVRGIHDKNTIQPLDARIPDKWWP